MTQDPDSKLCYKDPIEPSFNARSDRRAPSAIYSSNGKLVCYSNCKPTISVSDNSNSNGISYKKLLPALF